MQKQTDILVICDTCVDFIVRGSDVVPEFKQKEKLVEDTLLELGGSNCIFAVQAAKLGSKVTALGKVGDDIFGAMVSKKLSEAGVNIDYLTTDNSVKTGVTLALCKEDDRAMLTYPGSINALQVDEIPRQLLQECRHLHVGSYFLLHNLRPHFMEMAKQVKWHGGTVSLDTNWDPEERWEGILELLPYVDIFLPNENELLAITNKGTIAEALHSLSDFGGMIVVKLGEKGAMAKFKDHQIFCDPIRVDYVDSVGAGDSFDAGFLYGFLQGESLERCLQFGSYCGAYNTTAQGGIAGQLTLSRLHNLLE